MVPLRFPLQYPTSRCREPCAPTLRNRLVSISIPRTNLHRSIQTDSPTAFQSVTANSSACSGSRDFSQKTDAEGVAVRFPMYVSAGVPESLLSNTSAGASRALRGPLGALRSSSLKAGLLGTLYCTVAFLLPTSRGRRPANPTRANQKT